MMQSFKTLLRIPALLLCLIMIIITLFENNYYIGEILFCFWIYIVNINIFNNMSQELKSKINISTFKAFFIIAFIMLLANGIFYSSILNILSTIRVGGLPVILALKLPLLISLLYLSSFSSKIIVSNEENKISSPNDRIITFIEHLVFPIGIYFLHNEIIRQSKLINHE